MLDRKFIVENADLVEQNCRNRNVTTNVRQLVEMEMRRRARPAYLPDLTAALHAIAGIQHHARWIEMAVE